MRPNSLCPFPPQPRSRRAAKGTRHSSGGRRNPLRLMRGLPFQMRESGRVSRQCRRPAAGAAADTPPPPSASAARLVLLTPSPDPGVGQAAGARRPSGSAGSAEPLPAHPALPATIMAAQILHLPRSGLSRPEKADSTPPPTLGRGKGHTAAEGLRRTCKPPAFEGLLPFARPSGPRSPGPARHFEGDTPQKGLGDAVLQRKAASTAAGQLR
jgi:hypothetical protein